MPCRQAASIRDGDPSAAGRSPFLQQPKRAAQRLKGVVEIVESRRPAPGAQHRCAAAMASRDRPRPASSLASDSASAAPTEKVTNQPSPPPRGADRRRGHEQRLSPNTACGDSEKPPGCAGASESGFVRPDGPTAADDSWAPRPPAAAQPAGAPTDHRADRQADQRLNGLHARIRRSG